MQFHFFISCIFFLEILHFYYLFYLFMAVLGLGFCARAFSSCGKWGPLFIAVRGPPTIVASLVAEHGLQTRRLSNCGSRAQLLRGMWDPPGPGLEPASPALAGGFSTTAPPGKPWAGDLDCYRGTCHQPSNHPSSISSDGINCVVSLLTCILPLGTGSFINRLHNSLWSSLPWLPF